MADVPTKSTTFKFRVPTAELERWRAYVGPTGLARMIRRAVNEYVDAALAEERDASSGRKERIEEIAKSFPQGEVTTAALGASLHYAGKKSYKPDPR